MNIVNKKPQQTKNVFYGVDVNDKQAVEKEYKRLQSQHRKITILVIIVLAFLGVVGFDFYRVNFIGGKPIFAVHKKVDRGTLFSGLGYKVLYCDNGERYIGSVLYKTCEEPDIVTFTHVVYEKLVDYGIKNKIIEMKNLNNLTINSLEKDEENDQGGSDYLLDITYECKDGSSKCFKTDKEFNNPLNKKIYIRINRYNEIYELLTFKNSGAYYDKLVLDYTEKVKNYLVENDYMNLENTKSFGLSLTSNNGKYKFRGNVYADSYLVGINYVCKDNGNECIKALDKKDIDGDFSNLSFYASMFLDENNNVLLVGPREYLEIE